MRIKICGITQPQQGKAIADFGATALGFICVTTSPRYVTIKQIQAVVEKLPSKIDNIGVFANTPPEKIKQTVVDGGLTGVQLHGDESPEFCQQLRELLPGVEIIKALRIRTATDLDKIAIYNLFIDTLLLDAYHPQQLGGTGKILDWQLLQNFQPGRPWFLAGGLTPSNILEALSQVKPTGIDLSSGVERAPGDKDLQKIAQLFEKLGNR
ncbi:phosphoribosylanthranilate isomerase [Fischerella thermalis CCMEE 5268]|uniref:N-(5'-phosphoribosyl)anthranilate isomerase n=1 Tax=Fischerella thermalis CCMEE 5268 TaxID=2019662 RepID=A0A2N6KDH4_9CYAN|nr:phosphoribosylanthranilate isomerase [Fischerella thermalis]PLZ96874.1 phosphoribosylanthranilate isomerase [Fischerella thermalis CCMEE 5268]